MPHGITTLKANTKVRAHTRIGYDREIGLGLMRIEGFDGGLSLRQNLRADQLQDLIDQATSVLAQMLDDKAIGTDTLHDRNLAGIDRLQHLLNRGDL